jgi:hypothetical protein
MRFRWLIALTLALLVTFGLAAGIAAAIQALMPLMAAQWIDDRWLWRLSLATVIFSLVALMNLAVKEYRRRRADKSS